MKKKAEFDFAETLPITRMDEDNIEIEATDLRLKFYLRGFAAALIILGLLEVKFIPKDPDPPLRKGFPADTPSPRILGKDIGSGSESVRRPYHRWQGPAPKGYPYYRRDKKGTRIWCREFPPVDQVAFVAAFLDAFINGYEESPQEYISSVKID